MYFLNGAGCENRTRDLNLEGSSFTTKLTLHWHPGRDLNPHKRFWRPLCCHYTTEKNFYYNGAS